MGRSPARRGAGVVLVAAAAVTLAACGSTGVGATTTSTPPTSTSSTTSTSPTTSTTSTTAPPATTTTLPVPSSPQPSAEGAATALVSSWASGDRARALTVATASVVATLFAIPYPSGLAIDRGCSSTFLPLVCTFGPPAGGPSNAAIYQLAVSQVPGGWYVSGVQVET